MQKPHRNPFHSFSIEHSLQANHCRIGIYWVVMSLCLATTCFAGGSGPGIAFKVGAQTMDSPFDLDKTTRARFELEFASPRFGNDYFDVALTFGGSSFGCFHDEYAGYDDGVLIEEFYTDRFSIFDVGLVGRLYPLGDNRGLQPYVGAGIGYFWFLDSWKYEYYETYEDPFFPGVFYTYIETDECTETLAHGFFPFVTAGLAVPINSNFNLLFEAQYHYGKKDSGFDFGGPVYMFGCLFRF
jgi:hypothetical protein